MRYVCPASGPRWLWPDDDPYAELKTTTVAPGACSNVRASPNWLAGLGWPGRSGSSLVSLLAISVGELYVARSSTGMTAPPEPSLGRSVNAHSRVSLVAILVKPTVAVATPAYREAGVTFPVPGSKTVSAHGPWDATTSSRVRGE